MTAYPSHIAVGIARFCLSCHCFTDAKGACPSCCSGNLHLIPHEILVALVDRLLRGDPATRTENAIERELYT